MSESWSPVYAAAREGDVEKLRALISAGGDVRWRSAEAQWTPMHVAAGCGRADVIKLLASAGADADAVSRAGETPLFVACAAGHVAAAAALVADAGADAAKADAAGATPIVVAARGGHRSVVEMLLRRGTPPETALHEAAANGHTAIVEDLLRCAVVAKGVDGADADGRTALLRAAENGHAAAAKALLAAGADPSVADARGRTPAAVAAARGFAEIAALFEVPPKPLSPAEERELLSAPSSAVHLQLASATTEETTTAFPSSLPDGFYKDSNRPSRVYERLRVTLWWALATACVVFVASISARFKAFKSSPVPASVIAETASPLVLAFASVASLFAVAARRRGVWPVHFASLFLGLFAAFGAALGFCLAFVDFGYAWHEEPCVEREAKQWNVFSMCCLRGALTAVLFGTACTLVRPLLDVVNSNRDPEVAASRERDLSAKPTAHIRHKVIKFFGALITVCFTPRCCHGVLKKNPAKVHVIHHCVQLVYEIILLVVAIIEGEYINILAIAAGLCASAVSVVASKFHGRALHFFRADLFLNSFALAASMFMLPLECGHVACADETGVKEAIYIVLFAVGADSIRLNSVLHTTVEHQEELHNWLALCATGVLVISKEEQHSPSETQPLVRKKKTAPVSNNLDAKMLRYLASPWPRRAYWITLILLLLCIGGTVAVVITWVVPSGRAAANAENILFCEILAASNKSCMTDLNRPGAKWTLTLRAELDAEHGGPRNVTGTSKSHCISGRGFPVGYYVSCWFGEWSGVTYERPTTDIASIFVMIAFVVPLILLLIGFPVAVHRLRQARGLKLQQQQQQLH